MAIQIIAPPPPEGPHKRCFGICKACRVKILAERNDGIWYQGIWWRASSYLAVDCPTIGCAETIICREVSDAEATAIVNTAPNQGQ